MIVYQTVWPIVSNCPSGQVTFGTSASRTVPPVRRFGLDFVVRRTAPSGASFAGAAPGFGPDDTLLWVCLSNVFARQCSASIDEGVARVERERSVRGQRLLGRLASGRPGRSGWM